MLMPIQPLAFDSILTIVFKNNSQGGKVNVWVCESPQAFKQSVEELEAMNHIEIIHKGASVVARERPPKKSFDLEQFRWLDAWYAEQ